MSYYAGIDGGGTKTHCVVGDHEGRIIAEGFSSGSNHQIIGAQAAKAAISASLDQALGLAGIRRQDLSLAVLGLAGADLEPDFAVLNGICREIFGSVPFRIMNDSWIGLRAGIPENWGIVTVCGTGAACSGRSPDGREVTLRNLTYETGNIGGGSDLIREAFHSAFRSEEGTGKKTRLETELPLLFGVKGMADLLDKALSMDISPDQAYAVPVLVGELAFKGDEVCQKILLDMGRSLGEIAGGVIRKLHMENTPFQVTLVGGIFKTRCPLLVDEYTTTVHRTAPCAKVGVCRTNPAIGAYMLARDMANHKPV